MDGPREIELTKDEIHARSYQTLNLQSALEGLHQDGLLVLKDVIDVTHVDHLRKVMSSETQSILRERAGMYNQGVNSNILQCPPVSREDCLFDDVFFNEFVVQVVSAYLGNTPVWNFTTANNALSGTSGMRQPVHKDITFHHPTCPFYLIANVVLSDFDEDNGATEFWLGTHARTTSQDQVPCTEETKVRRQTPGDPSTVIKSDLIEARRLIRPPVRAKCKKGDVMLRDLRTWHAGMPNDSNRDRIMIAIGYQAPWYPNNTQRLYLPLKNANFFMRHGGQPLEVRANFLDEHDMARLSENYNFTFEPSVSVNRDQIARL